MKLSHLGLRKDEFPVDIRAIPGSNEHLQVILRSESNSESSLVIRFDDSGTMKGNNIVRADGEGGKPVVAVVAGCKNTNDLVLLKQASWSNSFPGVACINSNIFAGVH